jgi:mannose/fructose/sorbose-specific phosphotransferase system IIA component
LVKKKLGIVLASHGPFAQGALQSAQLIFGHVDADRVFAITLNAGDNVGQFADKLAAAVKQLLQENERVVILTDMLGGSPNNSAMALLLNNAQVDVIAGFNMGTVIELLSRMDTDVDINELVKQGQQALLNVREKVEESNKEDDDEWL